MRQAALTQIFMESSILDACLKVNDDFLEELRRELVRIFELDH